MAFNFQLSWGIQSSAPQYTIISAFLILGTLTSLLVWRFSVWFRLRHLPGPLLASLTNFTRMSWVSTKKAHLIHQEMHRKYGDVVRLGPNMVSISDPSAIFTIYPMRKGFVKNDFYVPLRPYTKNGGAVPNVFTALDEDLHMKLKYPVASFFSLSNVSKFEGLVDEVLQVIDQQLERRFASHGEIFDLTEWLQFFAFDVMGTMTFSKRYGFLEQGKDVGGMLDAIAHFMKQAAPMMQIPWLDKVLYKNQLADTLRPTPGTNIMKFVGATIQERQKLADESSDFTKAGKGDFLDRYISTQKSDASIPPWFVTAWTISNVLAGSDSVGTVMKTTMYNLLKSPETLEKLRKELSDANVSRPYPRWSEVNNLPYLDACVQEALRVHPPFAMPFERIVPEGGIHISGQYIPAGTVVGASPYVVNRHIPTYGDDAEFWRPERWLEGDSDTRKKRDDGLLTFGAGRRVCLGKHIGIFEVKKLVPFLLLNYDISMVNPEGFVVENQWFFRQSNLHAQIRKIPLETGESKD